MSQQQQASQKQLKEFSRDEVAKHNKKGDVWIIIDTLVSGVAPMLIGLSYPQYAC